MGIIPIAPYNVVANIESVITSFLTEMKSVDNPAIQTAINFLKTNPPVAEASVAINCISSILSMRYAPIILKLMNTLCTYILDCYILCISDFVWWMVIIGAEIWLTKMMMMMEMSLMVKSFHLMMNSGPGSAICVIKTLLILVTCYCAVEHVTK
jgi:hypothetical protein